MKVSIALCTYNGEQFLAEQLNSLVAQTHLPNEIIICDDCSSDRSMQISENFIKITSSNILLYTSEKRNGPIKNFEKAISLCTGDIIFLCDQDDIWIPEKIATFLKWFKADPSTLLIFTNAILINENNTVLEKSLWEEWGFNSSLQKKWKNNKKAFYYLFKKRLNKATGATMAFRRKLKEEALPFILPTGFWHDAWLALLAAGYNGLRFKDTPLIKYRIHKNQQVGTGNGSTIRNALNNIEAINELINNKRFKKIVKQKFPTLVLKNKLGIGKWI